MRSSHDIGVEPGDLLAGKYRVERVLGAGGMGVVVEATHTVLADRVALKFLKPHVLDDPKIKARFLQEAQASVRIRSPHVARVLDVGELETGAPYIVMEYLEGTDLDAVLDREGKLEPAHTCDLTIQVCEALAVAHAAGVIHRDIKPANLFVTRAADGTPQIKVLDFGISKVLKPLGGTTSQDLTQTQTAMGSPPYMSPEQMRSTKNVDSRTDVWSLGVVLYRALAGRLPFQSDSMPELCALVLDAERPPLRELAPEVPEDLEMIVDRCLQPTPADRYQNVAALAEALASHGSTGADERAAKVRRILVASRSDEARAKVDLDETGGADRTTGVTRRGTSGDAVNAQRGLTGTSFGYTQSSPSRFPRAGRQPLLLGAVVLLLVGVSVGVGMWLAGGRDPESAVASAVHDPAVSASVSAAAAAPPVVMSVAPPEALASAPSASSAAAPLPPADLSPEKPKAPAGPAPRPRPSPAAAPRPPADPFASRH